MAIKLTKTPILGSYVLQPEKLIDNRGYFVKTFEKTLFTEFGIKFQLREQYYSLSTMNVLRGLHFQVPPHDHSKLVYCVSGCVLDAILDIRVKSPTFGKSFTVELSDKNALCLYVPSGLAHGFFVKSKDALMIYNVSTEYSSKNDKGIRWDTAGIEWPHLKPIISERDSCFPSIDEFKSPF